MNNTYITASELADYIYCECCWADKIDGLKDQTGEMLQGIQSHDSLQWQYTVLMFLRRLAIVITAWSVVILIVFLVVLFLTGNI